MTITSKPGTVSNWNQVFGRSRSVVLQHLDDELDQATSPALDECRHEMFVKMVKHLRQPALTKHRSRRVSRKR